MTRRKLNTLEAAHGRWREILPSLGLPSSVLVKRDQPCPACGGKDRFRFSDKSGDGDYFCRKCGPGKGISLVAKVNGWSYAEAANKVDAIIGNLPSNPPSSRRGERKRFDPRLALRRLWEKSQKIELGDKAWEYLSSRGIDLETVYPEFYVALRYVPEMYNSDNEDEVPGIIAIVSDAGGDPSTIHRTYLADVRTKRKLMPGSFPTGGAIRLGPPASCMGVAEGIETALAASYLYKIPVWSTVAAPFMANWNPPPGVDHIIIFGDNDVRFAGQEAAYALAARLRSDYGMSSIDIKIPDKEGEDWNDVLLRSKGVENARAA